MLRPVASLARQHARPLGHYERLEMLMRRPGRLHCLVLREHGLHWRRIKGKASVFLDWRLMTIGVGRPRSCGVILEGGLVRVVLLVLDAYVAHGDQKANAACWRTVRLEFWDNVRLLVCCECIRESGVPEFRKGRVHACTGSS